MKKILLLSSIFIVPFIYSCKPVQFVVSAGNGTVTNVNLSQANFKNLGNYTGTASMKKALFSIKDKEGLGAEAKQNLIENAKKAGVELTGSRILTNVIIDKLETKDRVNISISADIIEFDKLK